MSLLSGGLFYEFAACICAGFLGFLWCHGIAVRKHVRVYINETSLGFFCLVIMYLVVCLYGVDKGMGLIGFFQMLAVIFFLLCAMELSEENRADLQSVIPYMGGFMTVVGIVVYALRKVLPDLYLFFFTADRFGGFFRYANVYALFCLLGLPVLFHQEPDKMKGYKSLFLSALLMFGILISGSRSVAVLLIVLLIVTLIYNKQLRPVVMSLLLMMLIGVVIYVLVTGNRQNIGRLLTASLSSSTLLGRILYWKDGLRLLCHHPFGLGYLGYYYMEGSIQTGVYDVRYIHNDLLQLVLDVGVLPCVLFVLLLGKGFMDKKREISYQNGCILVVMFLHSLFDFDLEFTAMWFVLILSFDIKWGRQYEIRTERKKIYQALVGSLATICLYMGTAMCGKYAGNARFTARLLPCCTESQTQMLRDETDAIKAKALALRILKQNAYVAEAYDILAVVALQEGSYREAEQKKWRSVQLQKYHADAYDRYVLLLGRAISECMQTGDEKTAQYLMEKMSGVKEQIIRVLDETDPLAYQIRDLPNLHLSDEAEHLIRLLEPEK